MKPLVTIAIPDLAGPTALSITLAALARHTAEPHEVMLLVEAGSTQITRPDHQTLQQLRVPAPFGAPAALNRLLAVCETPYILLLESGATVTSGWLSRLLEPFDDASVGLSGPSTNICWNEQQVLSRTGETRWSIAQIDTYAAGVAARYRGQRRALDTLHSLNDFCFLFKRSVAEQLGGFDEAYGAGPCWEIDFNTRAARAGFKGIWVADAYVHRAPPTPAQVQTIRRLFTTSKHLYQDRFCGLRLCGQKTNYEPHCRGEACEHFAPPDLIQVTLHQGLKTRPLEEPPSLNAFALDLLGFDVYTFPPGATGATSLHDPLEGTEIKGNNDNAPGPLSVVTPPVDTRSNTPPKTAEERDQATVNTHTTITSINDPPLVSCIMPTRNRRIFVRQALAYFERQDYPSRELIIVDDGDDRVCDLIPPDTHVRYLAVPQKTSIGAKRNIACEQARGDIIAHWDDDDWYASHRLEHQIAPLLAKQADMTGLETSCFFDLTKWEAWTCSPDLHRRLFVGDVHGGTLVYWRRIWESGTHYPDASLAEDAYFLQLACRRGARLQKLSHDHSFVYLRHGGNVWRFPLGTYLQPADWKRAGLSEFLPSTDLSFYAALSPAAPSLKSYALVSSKDAPLVSCIMPTYNRRAFVPRAIEYFLRQEYANKELIIVDDGTDIISDLIPLNERICYIHLREKTSIGAKRNLACEQARGAIIAHWDDDDWHAPHRLSYQVRALLREGTDMCGTATLLYYDAENGRAWQYVYPHGQRPWLAGSTLCYTRAFWTGNRFANIDVGEDARFVWRSRPGRVTRLTDATFHVGIIHKQNVSPKKPNGSYWRPYPVEEIQRLLGTDWNFYYPHQVGTITDLQSATLAL